MFESFFAKFAQVVPRVKADDDEELIDPQQVIRKSNEIRVVDKQKKPNTPENAKPVNYKKKEEPPKNPKLDKPLKKDTKPVIKNVDCRDNAANENNGEGNGNGDDDDEDELVDPLDELREKCREGHHAVALAEKYEACNQRVLSKSQTAETCVEELFDLLHAIDHCVTEKLFAQLK